jgi:TPR repeat protein
MRFKIVCVVFILLSLISASVLAESAEKGEFNETQRLALEGDSSAQFDLGLMYYKGQGVGQDYAQALKWFKMAAEHGIPEAQFNLGIMYSNEEASWHSFAEAIKWFQKAAKQNYTKAQYNIGVMYILGEGVQPNNIKAYAWLSLAYDNGEQRAKNVLLKLNSQMTSSEIEKAVKEAEELSESIKK